MHKSGKTLTPQYTLELDDCSVVLNDHLGAGISLTYLDQRLCSACGQRTRKLYNRSYCYDCFSSLARCDLCIVSPDRCHIHLGTCREPTWAEGFCMQPHTVYLSNTSGPKVGITRAGREHRRWVDQGASSARKIIHAPSRRAAGVVEAFFKRYVQDRTDWRRLVSGRGEPANLEELAQFLQRKMPALESIEQGFVPAQEMQALAWSQGEPTIDILYPVDKFSPAQRLKLSSEQPKICDNLRGIVGQYLLLSQGVINILDYQSAGLHVALGEPIVIASHADTDQLSLF